MSLARYADECRGIAEELIESLSAAEIAGLCEQLTTHGYSAWHEWRELNRGAVRAFAAATPSARRSRRNWQECLPALTLAAYQHCMEAADLLYAAAQLRPGGSYRKMAGEAGDLYQGVFDSKWPQWPMDWDEDPFADPAFLEH